MLSREEFDALGDKHKKFESLNQIHFLTGLPVMVRLDGCAFHTYTKGLDHPYDVRLTECLNEVCKHLLSFTNAHIVYRQSDEITLILPTAGDIMYGGRRSKIESILAAQASAKFAQVAMRLMPDSHKMKTVAFDARAWQLPNTDLCVENLIWRESDATRNSLTMAVASKFNQKDLHKVNSAKQHDMLHSVGINWSDYPPHFKRGTYFAKRNVFEEMDQETIARIPEAHRPKPGTLVHRRKIVDLNMPPILKVTNIKQVIFYEEAPLTQTANEN